MCLSMQGYATDRIMIINSTDTVVNIPDVGVVDITAVTGSLDNIKVVVAMTVATGTIRIKFIATWTVAIIRVYKI